MNKIHIKVPDWVGKLIPGLAGKSWGINLGKVTFGGIPLLQKGGYIEKAGMAMVGEKGPEILRLPQGAEVRPLESVTNDYRINIYGPVVREDTDIRKLAIEIERELIRLGESRV